MASGSQSTATRHLTVERSVDDSDEPSATTCARGHESTELELFHTRRDRSGRVLTCPACACKVLVTPGRLTGGETIRVIRPPQDRSGD
jgi:hypothetical protein